MGSLWSAENRGKINLVFQVDTMSLKIDVRPVQHGKLFAAFNSPQCVL